MKNLAIFVAILFISCTSENEKNSDVVRIGVEFNLLDNQGKDLLNPEAESNYNNAENIKIYHIINGEPILFNKPNLDLPNGFLIYNREDEDIYRLGVSSNIDGNTSTTLIEWNNIDTDTIRCDLNKYGSNVVITKVWYNNVLKYDGNGEIYFEVIK